MRYEIRDTRYEIRDTRYEIRDTRYEIRDTRYEIRDKTSWCNFYYLFLVLQTQKSRANARLLY
ncbi:hypothetical protein F0229_16210 [Vibrio sp. AIC-3]|nr:hypothetical protein [Vibrio sp. AIC-3]